MRMAQFGVHPRNLRSQFVISSFQVRRRELKHEIGGNRTDFALCLNQLSGCHAVQQRKVGVEITLRPRTLMTLSIFRFERLV